MKSEDGEAETSNERPRGAARAGANARRITGDRYRIGDCIGRGGMGEVLAARDEQIGREVAIKRIRDEAPSERAVTRFVREARIQGRLEHPAIPPVHELGRDVDGLPYFAMKKLAGTTLASILRAPKPSFGRQRLLRAFAEICLAVEFAHVHGVIHRDLKPENVMLGDFGEVYVLDWGVAKVVGESDEFDDIHSDELATRAGVAVGTPGYMAPEQERGDADVDARADVFSLGRVLGDILAIDPDAPPELAALRECAATPDRSARIQTARELGEAVQRYLDGDRDLALRRQLAGEHLARARTAFAGGDDEESRRTAMREAGRALALDPTLGSAAEVVSRLMLEPPRTPPAEVEAAMRADAVERTRVLGRAFQWGVLGFVAVVPGLLLAGSLTYVVAVGLVVAMAFVVATSMRRADAIPSPWLFAMLVGTILVLFERMFSTQIGTATVGALLAVVIASGPFLPDRRAMFVFVGTLAVTLIVPVLGGLAGWWPNRLGVIPDAGITILAPGLAAPDLTSSVLYALLANAGHISLALVLAWFLRASDQRMRRRLHLVSWQLRQLAPDAIRA
jgi:eukaryotic-like serine/threonine-protein kinase